MNADKLLGKIVENKKTQEKVAEFIGIDRSTFHRKIKTGGLKFTVEEMQKMVEYIPLTISEALEIFFG